MEVIWLVGIRLSLVSPCSPPYAVRSVMSPVSFLMLVIWVFSVFFLSQSSWTFNNFIGRLFKETGFPGGAGGKEPDCQRTDVKDLPSLGREDPLEEGVAVRSGVLAWRVPWTEEPGGLRSVGCSESAVVKRLSVKRSNFSVYWFIFLCCFSVLYFLNFPL